MNVRAVVCMYFPISAMRVTTSAMTVDSALTVAVSAEKKMRTSSHARNHAS